MSFITKQQVLAPSLILYSSTAWTQLPIRRSENPRHSRSSDATEIFSSPVLLSKLSPSSPKLPPSLMPNLPPYYLFYSSTFRSTLYIAQNCLSPSNRLLILHPQRSVASSRRFSKTFNADQIWSRIRRLDTLIEHASSMLAAAISIPAHSSKESHAIFMQLWWGAVTPSQLIHSHPEP
jgi:hypothetical protein